MNYKNIQLWRQSTDLTFIPRVIIFRFFANIYESVEWETVLQKFQNGIGVRLIRINAGGESRPLTLRKEPYCGRAEVENNKCFILWVWVCSLRYPAWNAHAPYCHLWPAPIYNIFPHYPIFRPILEKKGTDHKMCVFIFTTYFAQIFLILQGAAERSPLFGKLINSKPKKIRQMFLFLESTQNAVLHQRVLNKTSLKWRPWILIHWCSLSQ